MSGGAAAVQLPVGDQARREASGYWSDVFWRVRHDPLTLGALGVLALMIALAVGADLLADNFFHVSFSKQDLVNNYRRPTLDEAAWWLGSDRLGRSEIVRLLYGGRVSLFIGTFGALVSVSVGAALGISAGYFRGWWDDVIVWMVTTLNSIPTLFLLIIVGLLFRLDPLSLAVFIGLLGWLGICNISRGQALALREREFVLGARAIGASHVRVMLRHIFPNVLPLLVVIAMIDVGGIILAESALSYLGFGIQPPVPSWGNMLNGASQFLSRAPWLVYGPGLAISLTILCLYLIGDGLRDALDPRLRGLGGGRPRH
ncbi:MAG TPA: ABC transporter permease [Candidatus Limnocylindria bacterium]